jgi:hypothetical protein
MRSLSAIVIAATSLVAGQAFAQGVDLTGPYRCVQGCQAPGQVAFVTQNGWNLRLLNEVGEPSRAWIDWYGHLWAERWNEGAIFSADGMVIQFDRGTIWQRDLAELAPGVAPVPGPPPVRGRHAAAAPGAPLPGPAARSRGSAATTTYDGSWSVLILTQNGPCDRAYRYGVRISNGYVVNEGGEAVTLRGRVSPNGAIQVSVSSSVGQAEGEGRLSRGSGNGVWQGQSSGGSCAGTWQAERRG